MDPSTDSPISPVPLIFSAVSSGLVTRYVWSGAPANQAPLLMVHTLAKRLTMSIAEITANVMAIRRTVSEWPSHRPLGSRRIYSNVRNIVTANKVSRMPISG